MPEPLLVIEGLHVTFTAARGAAVRAVQGLDLAVAEGELVGIVGESGSGKSAAMLAVMGLLPEHAHVSGSVRYRGRSWSAVRRRSCAGCVAGSSRWCSRTR
ncbi:MAG: hypothetical protein KatS3mg010_0461 [Acidimicrobiia bacterium]|nr:MAG: hypothetical protein KatS3mg010_0461 [Acidimicrobiia bacterium]